MSLRRGVNAAALLFLAVQAGAELSGAAAWPEIRDFLAPIQAEPRTLVEIQIPFESLMQVPDSETVRRAAESDPGLRVIVDKAARSLRVMRGSETLFTTPVAVGSGKTFEAAGRRFTFATPIGKRRVLAKQQDPLWTPPDWHYYERAAALGFDVVFLKRDEPFPLSDETILEIRGDQVGRTNRFGNWWPVTPGMEILFDETVFAPPHGTAQRRIAGILGPFKLDMGDGFLIHGTNEGNADSIGRAASHGCVRVANDRLGELYALVPTGASVYIY